MSELLSMRFHFVLGFLLLVTSVANAGTVTGRITSASSSGLGNSTLTFTLTQAATAPSTANGLVPASIAGSGVNCWTDTQGNVAGVPGDSGGGVPAGGERKRGPFPRPRFFAGT